MIRLAPIRIEPGQIGFKIMGASEVCLHMRVTGKFMSFQVNGPERFHSVQLFKDDNAFSGSITYGEAGLFMDDKGLYFYENDSGILLEGQAFRKDDKWLVIDRESKQRNVKNAFVLAQHNENVRVAFYMVEETAFVVAINPEPDSVIDRPQQTALIYQLQASEPRKEIPPLELSNMFAQLRKHYSSREIAERIGRSVQSVEDYISLQKLSDEHKQLLSLHRITLTQAILLSRKQ